jgi:hypothetical protein
MGKLNQAREAYAAAEDLLDDASLAVPLNEGRGVFLTQRQSSATCRVNLLLRMGLYREACSAAGRSRARVLRQLQLADRLLSLSETQRTRWEQVIVSYRREREQIEREAEEDWTLSLQALAAKRKQRAQRESRIRDVLDEALSVLAGPTEASPVAPPPGVLELSYHPIREGWTAFATDEKATRTVTIREEPDLGSPDQLSRVLLEPFRREIEVATRIQVAASGRLRAIDFHALPWNDSVLLEAAPVAYGLDLPRRAEALDHAPPTVLIVTDPRGDLPGARKEGAEISELLRAKQYDVRWLQGKQATKQALLESLPNVRLLHYAGHGVYKGQDGWESVLPLANHTELTVGDVLALHDPPRHVVLSACESGRSSAGVGAESLGIAQALVTAGSESVVATVRRVDDQLAATISLRLHERIAAREHIDLPAALREVQLPLARAGTRDWQAYRVVNR